MADSNLYNEKFGAFLRRKRLEHGYTQQQLADKLGKHKTTIHRYECGEMLPDDSMNELIREILDIDLLEYYSAREGWAGNRSRLTEELTRIKEEYIKDKNDIYDLPELVNSKKITDIFKR